MFSSYCIYFPFSLIPWADSPHTICHSFFLFQVWTISQVLAKVQECLAQFEKERIKAEKDRLPLVPLNWVCVEDGMAPAEMILHLMDWYYDGARPAFPDLERRIRARPDDKGLQDGTIDLARKGQLLPAEALKDRVAVLAALCWTLASIAALPANKPDLLVLGVLPRVLRIARLEKALEKTSGKESQAVTKAASNQPPPSVKRDALRLLTALGNQFPYQSLLWPTVIHEVRDPLF